MRRMGVLLAAVLLCGCGRVDGTGEITAIVREEGSGTRAAFGEVFGLDTADRLISPDAPVTNSTSVVKLTVAGNPDAIGYLSLGAVDGSVRALAVDGVAPTPETTADGSYGVMRTFYLVTADSPGAAASDFLRFAADAEGKAVIRAAGFVPCDFAPPRVAGDPSARLVIAGSSSVTPLCEALRTAYLARYPGLRIEIQTSDSSTGAAALAAGICDIAMLSRPPAESESGVAYTVARDAIAVIVHPDNPITSLTAEEIGAIFTGEAVRWDEFR